MLSELDIILQEKLLNFVKQEKENKNPKPLKIGLASRILEQICNNEREITGLSTDYSNGDVFVRFSFTKQYEVEE